MPSLLQQGDQVLGFEPDRRRIVIGMDTDDPGRLQKCPVQKELHPTLFIVQKTKRRNRTRHQPQNRQQVLRRGKG